MVKLRIIPRDPVFVPGTLTLRKSPELPYPLNAPATYLFGYGRVALCEGLRTLGIKPGDNVLVPDYICNVVISSFNHIGIQTKFYAINRDLTPDWESVKKKIDRSTRAFLIVNYFGFANDLSWAGKFCKENKIFLIEDNAHGFLSSQGECALGSSGDISIFSFRKTFPMPVGAALVINNRKLMARVPETAYLQGKSNLIRFLIKSSVHFWQCSSGFLPSNYISNKLREIEQGNDGCEEHNINEYFIKFSKMSGLILKHLNVSFIAGQRRKMYLQWLDIFKRSPNYKAGIVFSGLPDGIVPYVFPVLVDNQKQFILEMWRKKIQCFSWPFLPENSSERYFSTRLVCLPVFPYSSPEFFYRN